jgi:hypothetical protein
VGLRCARNREDGVLDGVEAADCFDTGCIEEKHVMREIGEDVADCVNQTRGQFRPMLIRPLRHMLYSWCRWPFRSREEFR